MTRKRERKEARTVEPEGYTFLLPTAKTRKLRKRPYTAFAVIVNGYEESDIIMIAIDLDVALDFACKEKNRLMSPYFHIQVVWYPLNEIVSPNRAWGADDGAVVYEWKAKR